MYQFCLRIIGVGMAAVLFSAGPALAREFENEWVFVRDVENASGKPIAITAGRDAVVIDVLAVKAEFIPKGKAISAPSAQVILVELKAKPPEPLKNTTGLPEAFPRPGSSKVFENAEVTIWDYTWTAGKPPPPHFHSRDVVSTFYGVGALRSVPVTGEPTVTPHTNGTWRFQPRARTHTEELAEGTARGLIVELK